MEDRGDMEPRSENPYAGALTARPKPPPISAGRRRELLGTATELAEQFDRATEPHERRLLFSMLGILLDR